MCLYYFCDRYSYTLMANNCKENWKITNPGSLQCINIQQYNMPAGKLNELVRIQIKMRINWKTAWFIISGK